MIPNMNLSQVKSKTIDAGGYVCRVVAAIVDKEYNRLQLELDISEGPKVGYFSDLQDRAGFWGLTANLYMDEDSKWKFSNAIEAFRDSNEVLDWEDDRENDEQNLVGKYVGAITQKYHYIGNDGRKKSKLLVYRLIPKSDIRTGNFKLPDDKYADNYGRGNAASGGVVDTTSAPQGAGNAASGFGPVNDDDIPF